ncbi:MAG: hypothetical protein JWQ65_3092 [Devosia sp.]|nr:hypothetical protein [Devosia sp.]
MNGRRYRLAYIVGITVAATLPTLAEPANWALAMGPDSHTLNFFSEDASFPENLGLRLICAHGENDDIIGTSIQIFGDDRNGATAKALIDFDPYGRAAAAQLVYGATKIPAPVWAFRLEADGMNGAWDLTLDFSDNDQTIIHQLADATGPIGLAVGSQTYDLTPRSTDLPMFRKFAKSC